ncbi:hypothetical protein CLCHR_24930 [Clostridium chromiireducens]|uniref:Uncharacterized protein n=1 Tax=Clostridium chromiireducens TaxID=225345 RepID=A0A1V4IN71_9CLOT|nr:hypothetical protein CLCHR_24930 [Clostridium chromiireducens]
MIILDNHGRVITYRVRNIKIYRMSNLIDKIT